MLKNIVANLINSDRHYFEKEERTDSLYSRSRSNKKETTKNVVSFDSRMRNIIMYLKEIHQLQNQNEAFTLNYLFELFDRDIMGNDRDLLIKKINAIGFDKLKNTFERINMECEDYFCESEDLFGIFKRHQFNKKLPGSNSEKLQQVIQYIHVSLIHINILHKSGI